MRTLNITILLCLAFLAGCSEYPYDFANTDMQIFEIEIDEITTSTARITWKTSKKGTTEVYYKRISSVEKIIISDEGNDIVLDHRVILKDLVPQEDYFCRIISQNDSEYKLEIDDLTFTTKPHPQIYPEENPL